MKSTKKLFAVILALVMMLSVLPFTVLADEEVAQEEAVEISIEDRVAGWKENYGMLLNYLFDNEEHIAFNYLVANDESLQKMMTMSTVLALHDGAWKNALTGEMDEEIAEGILLSLVERVESDLNTNTVDIISKVLDGIDTAGDAVEKVNDVFNITEEIGGDTWNDVFKYLGYAITAVNTYKDNKEEVIEMYAKILSAQAAAEYFTEYLQYIIDNCEYDVLVYAAETVLESISLSAEEIKEQLIAALGIGIAEDIGEMAASAAIDVAINSNVYTAAAKTIYSTGVKVADYLWNVSDAYNLIEGLYISFFAETLANEWAQSVMDDEDANKTAFAISSLITLRQSSNTILQNYKTSQAGGIIGKIKNKINKYVTAEYTVEESKLALIQDAFFTVDPADYAPVTAMFSVFCPVDIAATVDKEVVFTLSDGNEAIVANEYGLFAENYCEYSEDFLKIAFVTNNEGLLLTGTQSGKVSVIMDIPGENGNEDWSFTEYAVAAGSEIYLDGVNNYFVVNDTVQIPMNDDYVLPAENEVTTEAVVDAGKAVVKEEATTLIDKIKALFQKIADFFKNLFK